MSYRTTQGPDLSSGKKCVVCGKPARIYSRFATEFTLACGDEHYNEARFMLGLYYLVLFDMPQEARAGLKDEETMHFPNPPTLDQMQTWLTAFVLASRTSRPKCEKVESPFPLAAE